MTKQDIRCIQRLSHFSKALEKLEEAVNLASQRPLSELEQQGIIQAFEFTHELAWNTMKDFLENRGVGNIFGSKDATSEAFKQGLIHNGEIWMEMINDRNLTPHTYNEEITNKIALAVVHSYFDEFLSFQIKMNELKREEEL